MTTTMMMACTFLVMWAVTPSASQSLTADDITKFCVAVSAIGNCTSCNWCSVREGFPLKVKNLCRNRANTTYCSQTLSDFQCSTITDFHNQNCLSMNAWAYKIVCPIAVQAASCFDTTPTTIMPTPTTMPTTTPTTTPATTQAALAGPEIAGTTFATGCTQRCVRNDLVATRCGGNVFTDACNSLQAPAVAGQYTCCQG